jgi:hypothetical protein
MADTFLGIDVGSTTVKAVSDGGSHLRRAKCGNNVGGPCGHTEPYGPEWVNAAHQPDTPTLGRPDVNSEGRTVSLLVQRRCPLAS